MKSLFYLLFLIGTTVVGQGSDFEYINFEKADSTALKYKGASLKNLPILTHNLTAALTTDVEKFRAIYTWVCTNIENDYNAFQRTVKKRKKLFNDQEALTEWNALTTAKVFKRLLKHKKTACTGYAYLIREMALLADIKTQIINGYGRTATLHLDSNSIPNHSWNAVELNGKWYLCDPTWSAGHIILEDDGPRFKADYFDGYFLADPSLFIKNHFPLESKWALLAETPKFQQFSDGPVVYKEAFKAQVIPIAPIKMQIEILKYSTSSFVLKTKKPITNQNLFLVIAEGTSFREVKPSVSRNENEIVLEHRFSKTGKFDVHIKVEDDLIATYVVRVKRK